MHSRPAQAQSNCTETFTQAFAAAPDQLSAIGGEDRIDVILIWWRAVAPSVQVDLNRAPASNACRLADVGQAPACGTVR